MDTQTGNRIIAEFMGAVFHKESHADHSMKRLPKATPVKPTDFMVVEDLAYHTSWDWQVPAWNKLYLLLVKIDRNKKEYNEGMDFVDNYGIHLNHGNIKNAFECLTEAIQWYNTHITD